MPYNTALAKATAVNSEATERIDEITYDDMTEEWHLHRPPQ